MLIVALENVTNSSPLVNVSFLFSASMLWTVPSYPPSLVITRNLAPTKFLLLSAIFSCYPESYTTSAKYETPARSQGPFVFLEGGRRILGTRLVGWRHRNQTQVKCLIFLAIALVLLSPPLESCAKQGNSITSRSCVAPSILIREETMTLVSAVALIFQCGGGYLRSVLFKKNYSIYKR